MHLSTPTRFNSHAQLCKEVRKNSELLQALYEDDPDDAPDCLKAFVQKRVIEITDRTTTGLSPSVVKYCVGKELTKFLAILNIVTRLTTIAEDDSPDPFVHELEINKFMMQLKGLVPLEVGDTATVERPLDTVVKGSKFMPCIVDSFKYATAYYFDRHLTEDWGLLLCMILHPCCAGHPAANAWPCISARFDDLWVKEGGVWVYQGFFKPP